MITLLLHFFIGLSFVYGQYKLPPNFITTLTIPNFAPGIINSTETQILYNDTHIGQRISRSTNSRFSTLYLQDGKRNAVIYYTYNGIGLDSPLCCEFYNQFYPNVRSFSLDTLLPITGSVNGQQTLIFESLATQSWIYAVNNSFGYYYPVAISTLNEIDLISEFKVEIPTPATWELPPCFYIGNAKRSLPDVMSPFPTAFSLSLSVSLDSVFNQGVTLNISMDTVSSFFRYDYSLPPTNNNYPTLALTQLVKPNVVYMIYPQAPLTPVPCFFYNGSHPNPPPITAAYYGSVSLNMATKHWDIYGNQDFQEFFAFDSTTKNLEVVFGAYGPIPVQNWNPATPSPSVFVPPASCSPGPQANNDKQHPLAPILPIGFTMYITNGYYDFTIYYDGAKRFWRQDSLQGISIQLNTTTYTIQSPNIPNANLVKPALCTSSIYGQFIPVFTVSYGTFSFNGVPLSAWGTNIGSVWYFDAQNTPKVIYQGTSGPSYFHYVTFIESQTPPPSVFTVPQTCMVGSMKEPNHQTNDVSFGKFF